MQQTGENGIYHVGDSLPFLGVQRRILEGSVPPFTGALEDPCPVYGWAKRGLAVPKTGGVYVVEFETEHDVCILAYIDPFGRVFSTDTPLTVPPACEPDLSFAQFEKQPNVGAEAGCIYVRQMGGDKIDVAQYRCVRGHYELFDSWHNFDPFGADLTYNDALARAYLALVHRPSLGAPKTPERGLRCVQKCLLSEKPLAGLRALVDEVRDAELDPALLPPALVRCFIQWLSDAGFDELAAHGGTGETLRLVRTTRYANTFYLAPANTDANIPARAVWALEAALNRFLLVNEAFDENMSGASEADCARWDALLIETVAAQHPALGQLVDAPTHVAAADGEWKLRCSLAGALERLRLPVRVEVDFRADSAEGMVAFEATVPDSALMPARVWQDAAPCAQAAAGMWTQATAEERDQQARRYALHLGVALAAIAFDSSASLDCVTFTAMPLSDAVEVDFAESDGEFPGDQRKAPAFVQAVFDRATFERFNRFEEARLGDPLPVYLACDARFDVADIEAFSFVEDLASAQLRRDLPETREGFLPEVAAEALGSDDCEGVRVDFDSALRRMAEGLADRIVEASSATDAIRVVRAAQVAAAEARDDRAISACTHLMAGLAEGELDMSDQNAVVGCFLGEDRCLVALGRAKTLAQQDLGEAVNVLIDAVAEASALDGFVDGATTVFRTFDSYAARVLYNRARRGGESDPRKAAEDADKRVELVSDSFYLCHLEIVRLLEHSFERTDEALRYGRRAVAMAPTTAAGYRQLGRAYMLVGDMDNAATVLLEGLRIAVQPNDIAMVYYQLAYVLWKAGESQKGVACYLKSLTISPVVALQATAELHELVEESDAVISSRDTVDEELEHAGIPVAPTADVLEVIGEAAAAAVDAGLFPVARNLLTIRLRYRPDDALMDVLRSLGE